MSSNKQSLPDLKKEYLKIYTPKALRLSCGNITLVSQALEANTDSIATIKKELGVTKIEALIKVFLIDLNELLNLKRPLTERAINEIAFEVVSTYYNLTMADVYLLFKRAKTGYYGEFYESINITKVMRWFSDYHSERITFIADKNYNNHLAHKNSSTDRFSTQNKIINKTAMSMYRVMDTKKTRK